MMAQMAQQLSGNENIQQMLNNPDLIQQAMQMFTNPQANPTSAAQEAAVPTTAPVAEESEQVDSARGVGIGGGAGMNDLMSSLGPGMEQMMRNNPQLASMMEEVQRDPSRIGAMLSDPQMMSQMMSMAFGSGGGTAQSSENDDEQDPTHRSYYS